MVRITLTFGVVLILLGSGAYLGTGRESITALIPAFFGVVFVVLGAVAQNRPLRKHAIHGAALLALLGAVGSGRGLAKLPKLLAGEELERPAAVAVQSAMAVMCVVFLVLCVRSFMTARRARNRVQQT